MVVYKSLCEEHNDFFMQRYHSAKPNTNCKVCIGKLITELIHDHYKPEKLEDNGNCND